MKITTGLVRNYLKKNVFPLYTHGQEEFVGTGVKVSNAIIMTCAHTTRTASDLELGGLPLYLLDEYLAHDLSLLQVDGALGDSTVVCASSGPQIGESVFIYGFRLRDGISTDVLIEDSVGAYSSRPLAQGLGAVDVCGFNRRFLIEAGMSGAAVFRKCSLELLGLVVGYDSPSAEGRRDDIFVSVADAVADRANLRRTLLFSHQLINGSINYVRALLIQAGFEVSAQEIQLQQQESLRCLVAHRGAKAFKHEIRLVFPTLRWSTEVDALREIYQIVNRSIGAGSGQSQNVIVVSGITEQLLDLPDYCASVGDIYNFLVPNAKSAKSQRAEIDRHQVDAQFSPRRGVRTGTNDVRQIEDVATFIIQAIQASQKLLVLTGMAASGKRALLSDIANKLVINSLEDGSPIIFHRMCVLSDLHRPSFVQPEEDHSLKVQIVTDVDDYVFGGQVARVMSAVRSWCLGRMDPANANALVLSMSGRAEEVRDVFHRFVGDLLVPKEIEIIELLPLQSLHVKAFVYDQFGKEHGERLWGLINSTQEVFQIAQWPFGLLQIREQAARLLCSDSLPSPMRVMGGLVAGLHAQSLDMARNGTAASIEFLCALSTEMSTNCTLEVSLSRAKELYVSTSASHSGLNTVSEKELFLSGIVGWSIPKECLYFENPIYLHYFLALAVSEALQNEDITRANPLAVRRMPVSILRDVAELGITTDICWRLLQRLKSLDKDEYAYLAGNLVSLLRTLKFDFRQRDLSSLRCIGGIFTDCTLDEVDFSRAVLIDCGLANTSLAGAKLINVDLERSDLKGGATVYQFANNGPMIFAATSAGRLQIIELRDLTLHNHQEVPGFSDSVFSVTVNVEQRLLGAAGQDGTVRIWTLPDLAPAFVLRGHFSDVRSLEICENTILSGSVDGSVKRWSSWTYREIASVQFDEQVWSTTTLASGELTFVRGDGKHLHVVDWRTGECVNSKELPVGSARRVCFGTDCMAVGGEGFVSTMSTKTFEVSVHTVEEMSVRVIVLLHDGTYLAGGGFGKVAHLGADFSLLADIGTVGSDYISDFLPLDENNILVGNAKGELSVLTRCNASSFSARVIGRLDTSMRMNVSGALFSGVKNVPKERLQQLASAGAIVSPS